MKLRRLIDPSLLITNFIGLFFYLKFASLSWALPQEEGLDPAIAGVSMVWGLGALPILISFIAIDLIWWSFLSKSDKNDSLIMICSTCWVAAVGFDFFNH